MSRFRVSRRQVDYGGWDQGPRRRWRPRSRARGCLTGVILVILILIVLALLFGGFQKGTKSSGLAHFCTTCTSAPALPRAAGPNS